MNNNSFKLDDLDNKKYCFNLVLKSLKEDLNKEEEKDINESISNTPYLKE